MLNKGFRFAFVALIASVLMLGTACSWTTKKPPVKPTPTPAPVATATPAPPADTTDGVHDEIEVLEDLPQMQTIYFDYDQSALRPDQMAAMEANLTFLKTAENASLKLAIIGHCDERGTTEYNFALGDRRAASVRDYYVKNGVAAERIMTISKGEEEPVALGQNEAAWKQNRRAQFKKVVLKKN